MPPPARAQPSPEHARRIRCVAHQRGLLDDAAQLRVVPGRTHGERKPAVFHESFQSAANPARTAASALAEPGEPRFYIPEVFPVVVL